MSDMFGARWRVHWMAGSGPSRPAADPHRAVCALATAVVRGRPVAVACRADMTVQLWDLPTGRPAGQELIPSPAWRERGRMPLRGRDLATAVVNGRPVAVVVGRVDARRSGEAVLMWDLDTGRQIGGPVASPSPLVAVDATVVDGRPVAVTGDADGRVRVWDLTTCREVEFTRPMCHTDQVGSVATVAVDGRAVAVTGDSGHFGGEDIRVWDLASGLQVGDPFVPVHPRGSWTSMTAAAPGGWPVIVTEGEDGTVCAWDLAGGERVDGPLAGGCARAESTGALVAMTVDDRPAVATGACDGTLRGWRLFAGAPAQKLLDLTFPLPVRALAPAPCGGLLVGSGAEVALVTRSGTADARPVRYARVAGSVLAPQTTTATRSPGAGT
ncbi:WD40 repeat domain-containing protein [Planomonospora sp. ID67723]|uniref:WD40 repeat domain-containing protein n=1 Tax=Planomonospora sp. ID67723 TaxID=2738134 RepID=UPI0018C36D2B|nr:WD40 repeat domain-containing protein [Planomonospora sp. ID67723]MBG0829279.1 WD40 repeat domain-containing protein [Planomonospora sp. ID67723]